jgi:hypothetical protein
MAQLASGYKEFIKNKELSTSGKKIFEKTLKNDGTGVGATTK